jgi:hypothetical protein
MVLTVALEASTNTCNFKVFGLVITLFFYSSILSGFYSLTIKIYCMADGSKLGLGLRSVFRIGASYTVFQIIASPGT